MFALGLLLTTSLLVPAPQSPAPPPDTPPPTSQQPPSSSEKGTPTTGTDRPHAIGFGAFGGSGNGASFRYFMNDRLGVDMDLGWSLPSTSGSRNTVGGSGASFRAAPSGMYMLTKSHQLADIDVRPYVGAGLNYAASSAVQTATGQLRTGGIGMQAFGGAEFTFASAPSIAISAQVAYYRIATPSVNLLTTSGTDFYLLFHYYMK